jgi:hypothetical protein
MSGAPAVEIDVCNQTCDYLRQAPISSISPPSNQIEAAFARQFPIARRTVLRKYVWNFAKAEANISLVGTTTKSGSTVAAAITGITQAATGVVTAASHGFTTGMQISITGVVGMTQLNNTLFTVTVIDTNTFSLIYNGAVVNTVGYGAYVSGGVATPSQAVPLITQPSDFSDFYALPSDFIRFLSCGGASETYANATGTYDIRGKQLLINNSATATINLRYIRDVQDMSQWDDLARQVLSLTMAVALAYQLTGDPAVTKAMNALLMAEIPDAVSIDGQEAPPLRILNSSVLTARRQGIYGTPGYITGFPPYGP